MREISRTIGFANIVIIIISIRTNLIVQCSLSFTTKHYLNFSQWLFSFSPWYHRSPLISQVAATLLSRRAASRPNCGNSSPPCLRFQLISFKLGFGRLGKFTIINWMCHLHLFLLTVDSVFPIRTSHEELLLANKLAPLRAAGRPVYNNKWSFQHSNTLHNYHPHTLSIFVKMVKFCTSCTNWLPWELLGDPFITTSDRFNFQCLNSLRFFV